MAITTHILDTSRGRPAAGVRVSLEQLDGDAARTLGAGETDADGRLKTLTAAGAPLAEGTYRLRFETGEYFARLGVAAFYPHVSIVFRVDAGSEHYHVPLLLNPYGFSTYRGS